MVSGRAGHRLWRSRLERPRARHVARRESENGADNHREEKGDRPETRRLHYPWSWRRDRRIPRRHGRNRWRWRLRRRHRHHRIEIGLCRGDDRLFGDDLDVVNIENRGLRQVTCADRWRRRWVLGREVGDVGLIDIGLIDVSPSAPVSSTSAASAAPLAPASKGNSGTTAPANASQNAPHEVKRSPGFGASARVNAFESAGRSTPGIARTSIARSPVCAIGRPNSHSYAIAASEILIRPRRRAVPVDDFGRGIWHARSSSRQSPTSHRR